MAAALRHDFERMALWIPAASQVLDLGCGDGELLRFLREWRGIKISYGVEIDERNVLRCLQNGINVIQSDLDAGLSMFEDQSFDVVILSQTIQAVRHTESIVNEMLRVGREVIVSFPNFGHWSHRLQIVLGHMPVSDRLPYDWHNTPNIHLCTMVDFEQFCADRNITVLDCCALNQGKPQKFLPNMFATLAVYRLCKMQG